LPLWTANSLRRSDHGFFAEKDKNLAFGDMDTSERGEKETALRVVSMISFPALRFSFGTPERLAHHVSYQETFILCG